MSTLDALAVMLKAPVPGSVKTRLTPPLSEDEAAGLYRAFLADIFKRLGRLPSVDVHAFYTPVGKEDEILDILPEVIPIIPQKGKDLGERLYNVLEHLLKDKGYRRAAVIGTDSPDLPLEYIREAYGKLDEMDGGGVVFGPTTDGGYYLVAMDRLSRVPFDGIPWSTGRVLEATLKKAGENGLAVRLLKPWYDVDTVEDLSHVKDDGEAPETYGYIKKKRLLRRVR
jgi:rSAM/selenodomain-associated transferase 1